MKLAAALKKRSELSKELSSIRSRILDSLIIQEGQRQPEDVDELYESYLSKSDELTNLTSKINLINCTSIHQFNLNDDNVDLLISDAIHLKNYTSSQIKLINSIIEEGKDKPLMSKDEIKFESIIDRVEYATKLKSLDSQVQALDIRLQEVNWQVDIDD